MCDKCKWEGGEVKIGEHEVDPCIYEEVETHYNCTVHVLRCKKCGHIELSWTPDEKINVYDVIFDFTGNVLWCSHNTDIAPLDKDDVVFVDYEQNTLVARVNGLNTTDAVVRGREVFRKFFMEE